MYMYMHMYYMRMYYMRMYVVHVCGYVALSPVKFSPAHAPRATHTWTMVQNKTPNLAPR